MVQINLQATKLLFATSATKGGGYHPLRFSVSIKILYSVIQRMIQHCLPSKMVYLNIKYVIATRNYEFIYPPIHLSIHPSIYPYIHSSIHPSIHPSLPSLSLLLSLSLYVCLCMSLSVSLAETPP